MIAMTMVTLSSTRFSKNAHSFYEVIVLHKSIGIQMVKMFYSFVVTPIPELARKSTQAHQNDLASGKLTDMPPIPPIETIQLQFPPIIQFSSHQGRQMVVSI